MSDLDDRIRRALESDSDVDPALLPEDPSVWSMIGTIFRGRNGWMGFVAFLYVFVFMGLAVWFGFSFFGTEALGAKLGWGLGAVACFMAVGHLKLWMYMEMNKRALLREVKRMELQVAILSRRLGGDRGEG